MSRFQGSAAQDKPQKSQFATYEGHDNMVAAQPYDPMQARSPCLDSGVKSGGNSRQDPYAGHQK